MGTRRIKAILNGSFVENPGFIRLGNMIKHFVLSMSFVVEQSYLFAEQNKGRGPALRASSGVAFLCYLGSEVTILFLALV